MCEICIHDMCIDHACFKTRIAQPFISLETHRFPNGHTIFLGFNDKKSSNICQKMFIFSYSTLCLKF